MKYGIYAPCFGDYGDARTVAELAREGEEAGWDGFFIWDHILFSMGARTAVVDPWVALAAAAMNTERIRLGPLITPLARRRPWKVAREAVSLDHLSGGRLTLGVGLGEPPQADFEPFGEDPENRVRAEKLDAGLDILAGLMSGEPFSYSGQHHRIAEVTFLPKPVQRPRIPIWVAGTWPNKPPFRRAARWDGAFPIKIGPSGFPEPLSADDIRSVIGYVRARRARDDPFDVAVWGITPGDDRSAAADIVGPRAEAGATWWLESMNPQPGLLEEMRERIREGPPRVEG